MTLQEKAAHKTIIAEMKIGNTDSEKMRRMLREMFCSSETEVLEMLKDGAKGFERKVCSRVMQEHSSQIELNLCPKCQALARTSSAKLCPKCFYSWH